MRDKGHQQYNCDCGGGALDFAVGGADCAVKLWDFGSGRLLGTYAGHTSTVNKLNFSPDDNQLASVASDGSMVFWRIE